MERRDGLTPRFMAAACATTAGFYHRRCGRSTKRGNLAKDWRAH